MKETTLPNQFAGLAGKVNYVQKVSAGEWSSSCPQCGGSIHKGGDFPDRFRMWTNAHGKNKVMGWCRHCNYVWFPDSNKAMDPREFEKWRQEQLERERRIEQEAKIAIQNLQSEKIWENYHAQLNDWGWEVIRGWGILDDWAKYWKLGMVPSYQVFGKEEPYYSPGITIPMWQADGTVGNVKIRVLNPKSSADRYRAIYKTGVPVLFTAVPDLQANDVLITEGEKKAMVCAQYVGDKMQVVGIPTKTPNLAMLKQLDKFGKVVVCLDPDAQDEELTRVVNTLGRDRCSILKLPFKVDDMIAKHGLNLADALKYTKPIGG